MRKVQVFKWEMEGRQAVRTPDGEGVFHSFGISYEQTDFGIGQFTTAIIERADGRLHNLALDLVQFCDTEFTAPLPESFGEFVFDVASHKWREADEGEIGVVLYNYDQMNAARIAAAKLKAP